jgi:hypothetical protein
VELVPIWIQKGHAPEAGQAFVRWFLHSNTFSLELVEPLVDVGHVKMNEATD